MERIREGCDPCSATTPVSASLFLIWTRADFETLPNFTPGWAPSCAVKAAAAELCVRCFHSLPRALASPDARLSDWGAGACGRSVQAVLVCVDLISLPKASDMPGGRAASDMVQMGLCNASFTDPWPCARVHSRAHACTHTHWDYRQVSADCFNQAGGQD